MKLIETNNIFVSEAIKLAQTNNIRKRDMYLSRIYIQEIGP